jgi:hypothetical protein
MCGVVTLACVAVARLRVWRWHTCVCGVRGVQAHGVVQDYDLAYRFFHRAAHAGDAQAMVSLGDMYVCSSSVCSSSVCSSSVCSSSVCSSSVLIVFRVLVFRVLVFRVLVFRVLVRLLYSKIFLFAVVQV